jgi:hypothetical protein
MGAKSERPKNRKIKIVGGGFRWTRQSTGKQSGSMKALRRAARRIEKAKRKNKR